MFIRAKQPGSALLITLLVLGGVFIIAFGASYLVFFNTKGADADGQSIKAYYASLSGVERVRYERRKAMLDIKNCGANLMSETLNNTSTYQINCATSSVPGKIIASGSLAGYSRKEDVGYCFDITQECTTNCAIGSICGGGTLISLNPNIIVAPSDNDQAGCVGGAACPAPDSNTLPYANAAASTGANFTDDGRNNVAAIINSIGSLSDYPAALMCDSASINGFSGWYLPAQDEMNLLFRNSNLCQNNSGGPLPQECLNASAVNHPNVNGLGDVNDYWTSTEYDPDYAWTQKPTDGAQYNTNAKNNSFLFRCVRRF